MANVSKIRHDQRMDDIARFADPDGWSRTKFKEGAKRICEFLVNHNYSMGEAVDRLERLRVEIRDKAAEPDPMLEVIKQMPKANET